MCCNNSVDVCRLSYSTAAAPPLVHITQTDPPNWEEQRVGGLKHLSVLGIGKQTGITTTHRSSVNAGS